MNFTITDGLNIISISQNEIGSYISSINRKATVICEREIIYEQRDKYIT
jgi:hypothetical protein